MRECCSYIVQTVPPGEEARGAEGGGGLVSFVGVNEEGGRRAQGTIHGVGKEGL